MIDEEVVSQQNFNSRSYEVVFVSIFYFLTAKVHDDNQSRASPFHVLLDKKMIDVWEKVVFQKDFIVHGEVTRILKFARRYISYGYFQKNLNYPIFKLGTVFRKSYVFYEN